jgi:coniferyl-aldehyde dehydrogenase
MLPENQLDKAVSIAARVVARMYPTMLNNDQYTAMVNERHFERIQGYLDDANNRGLETVTINPAKENFHHSSSRKIPPTLVLNPGDDALCMQDEIFGPLLPLRTYTHFEEAISYINAHPRPLAAYYFGNDSAEERRFLTGTTSGGACVNDVMFQMLQKDLPFGGVGPSGMGAYHGVEGFKTFSHAKGVYKQSIHIPITKLAGFMPPYGSASEKSIRQKIKV